MRFKLDENLPRELADDLARLGHDTDSVHSEGLAGADDATVLAAAGAAGRILMTLDKGIGSVLRHPDHEHRGVPFYPSCVRAFKTCSEWILRTD